MSGAITPKYLCPKGYGQTKIGGRCPSLTEPWKKFGIQPRIFAPALISETTSRIFQQSSTQQHLPQDPNIFAYKYQIYLPPKEKLKARLEQITSELEGGEQL